MNYFAFFVFLALCGAVFCNPTTARSKSDCEEHRERELKSTVVAKVVPECDEEGNYKPKACYDNSTSGKPFCLCYSKDGQVVHQPSRNIEECNCFVEKYHGENPPRVGAFIPACKPNGHYEKKQCHGSTGMCWCAHLNGEKKTEPSRENVTCE
ncbi:putative neurotoxin LTDF S-18-like protein [Dinothrombium tinctorium]|uniref:Putative neurotoxin LTDF S-18-like protein n=1 Tax=Dinothrombium tinctorium TaxID=1965070 RepID=A0A3S3RJJ0_9ACAR|nr:putative neurotoxin LTDF S-18-like protein [Dinothrombium tinctorium]RWS01906.1 putative neurotoxin LTDF S-18-like protein [Dinothrombium tinctorium]RWS05410.1 putative neurotoxin LTDF S-18-like protein [Dinothrombium tinctorium]